MLNTGTAWYPDSISCQRVNVHCVLLLCVFSSTECPPQYTHQLLEYTHQYTHQLLEKIVCQQKEKQVAVHLQPAAADEADQQPAKQQMDENFMKLNMYEKAYSVSVIISSVCIWFTVFMHPTVNTSYRLAEKRLKEKASFTCFMCQKSYGSNQGFSNHMEMLHR